jgi:hypothetical protein
VHSFLGINTSDRYEPGTDDNADLNKLAGAMLPVDSDSEVDDHDHDEHHDEHHAHGFSEHVRY